MWTLSAPFDGEVGDVTIQKTKLLKTGTTYPLGRKGCPLVIASKKVSSNQCDFEVGDFTVDDAGDPTTRPKLKFINKKDKPIRVARGEAYTVANPLATCELQDGDVILLVSGVTIRQPTMGKSPVSVAACASLGIHILHAPNQHVTHHLLPSYTAQPLVAASLLSACQFAKLEWLQEVLRLGGLPRDADPQQGISLEHSFDLPALSKYRPIYSPSLLTSQKEPRVWEPNEERLMMFSAYRFLWVDEKARLGDFKDVIERGGGSFETFEAKTGKLKFHRALARGQAKEGKKQVVIGKVKSLIAAIGQGPWNELAQEANSFRLHIHDPEVILQVVIDVDTSLFDVLGTDVDQAHDVTPMTDVTLNTRSQGHSAPASESEETPARPKRLVRRTTSRQVSREFSPPPSKAHGSDEQQESSQPRRALTRRVNAGLPFIIGIDDPSVTLDSTPMPTVETPASLPAAVDPKSPARRPTNLKRRLKPDSQASQSLALSVIATTEPPTEPPLKKFKALFEASDPDNIMSGTFRESAYDESPNEDSGTQTQTQTQRKTGQTGSLDAAGNLSPLREEEEEAGTQDVGTTPLGTKRKLIEDDQMDVETSSGGKKRAIEGINSVENAPTGSKPPDSRISNKALSSLTSKDGAPPGKPDQDEHFLKAIASTKRGKKTEDDFDREFNKLKISKPELHQEEPEDQWGVVADFGDDVDVRGNFMVIVEMQAYHRDRGNKGGESTNLWQGKPNFKKFKNKGKTAKRNIVKLVLSEGGDYGMGASYWKGGKADSQSLDMPLSNPRTAPSETDTAVHHHPAPAKSQALMVFDDSDEDVAPAKGKRKAASSSRASSAVPTRRATTRSKLANSIKQPALFIESDDGGDTNELPPTLDDDESVSVPVDSDDEQTLRSTRSKPTRKSARAPPKKPALVVDDDSDDGAVFKGFRGKQRR